MKKFAKEFRISDAPQRSPKWYAERAGIPSASGLGFLFDTLRDGRTPSAKAKKYLKQLAFERKFGVTFERFQTKPMADGVFFEDFAKEVYRSDTGNSLLPAFSYVSSWFIATPDAQVIDIQAKKGLLECKIVGDETFMQMMEDGAPIEHELQTQSQLMASGYDWVDYIVVNLKTRNYFIIRVKRNNVLIKRIYERLHEPLDLPELKDIGVKQFDENLLHDFMGENNLIEEPKFIENLPF
jgi:hypothetical protein